MSEHVCGPDCPAHTAGSVEALTALAQAEKDGTAEKLPVHLGPFTAFVLIGALQLAWRHPDMNDLHKEMIEAVARPLQDRFGPPLWAELERGWDVTQDYDPH